MWPEFEKVLKQNEAALRSGERLSPKTEFIGQPILVNHSSYRPLIQVGEAHNFPVVDVNSQVGSFLQPVVRDMTEFSGSFRELVNQGYAQQIFDQYSIMAFLSPDGKFVAPDAAVRYAEMVEPHKGTPTGPQQQGRKLPDTPGDLRNGIWHHIPTGTEFFINDDLYRSGAPGGQANVADAPI